MSRVRWIPRPRTGTGARASRWRSAPIVSCKAHSIGIIRGSSTSAFRAWAAHFGGLLMQQEMEFWYEQFLGKPPGIGAPTPWHQDEAYWGRTLLDRGVTCWTAFHSRGPGKRLHALRPRRPQTAASASQPTGDGERPAGLRDSTGRGSRRLSDRSGTVTFHHSKTPHMTTGNSSDRWRLVLTQHFRNPGVQGSSGRQLSLASTRETARYRRVSEEVRILRRMRSEREKMLAGELYDPLDPSWSAPRRARDLCQDLNATREAEQEERRRILRELFGAGGDTVWMQPPFFCDYGSNILLGERVFFNFNCVVLDVCRVHDRRLHPVRPRGADLHRHAPDERRAAAAAGVRQADRDRRRTSGSAAGRSSARRADRLAGGHRRRQRGHPRHAGGVFAAGNPCRVIRSIA